MRRPPERISAMEAGSSGAPNVSGVPARRALKLGKPTHENSSEPGYFGEATTLPRAVTVHSPERKENGFSHCAAATDGMARASPPASTLETLRDSMQMSPIPAESSG